MFTPDVVAETFEGVTPNLYNALWRVCPTLSPVEAIDGLTYRQTRGRMAKMGADAETLGDLERVMAADALKYGYHFDNVPAPIAGDDPEWTPVLVVCDCEGPHFVGAQKSCRGLNGKNATGIYAN